MRTIEYKVSYENMISRIPGLFAYLDSDEFGNLSLHKATDSIDGLQIMYLISLQDMNMICLKLMKKGKNMNIQITLKY